MYVHSAGSIQLNSISAIVYAQRSATVSKRKSSAHLIAMAEMVVHSAQILELPKRHLILSISNQTQEQFHTSQVTMQNAVEEINKEVLANVLTDPRSAEVT